MFSLDEKLTNSFEASVIHIYVDSSYFDVVRIVWNMVYNPRRENSQMIQVVTDIIKGQSFSRQSLYTLEVSFPWAITNNM